MNGQIRLTEQGEVIASKYAQPEIGLRNLETLVAATLEATLLQPTQGAPKRFHDAASAISEASMAAYRRLVYETPGFTDYFFSATPIREIAELNIGSRPSSRKPSHAIEDLRAIPWSFSWGQCRVALPGWYGFGSAIDAFVAATDGHGRDERIALLQRMARRWPFFATFISNLDMVIAKSDLGIAARYVDLVDDRKLGKKIFAGIEAEWHRTDAALTLITGEQNRLASNPALARSIEHRFPYLDPLNHLQVELMRRYRSRRAGDAGIERVQRGIHISINGLAAGLRQHGVKRVALNHRSLDRANSDARPSCPNPPPCTMSPAPPSAPGDATIHLTLHGPATLAAAGTPAIRLERKQAAVLAYLHHAGSTPRGRLAGLLWPAAAADRARGNLRQCLARLRRIAPGVLAEAGDAIALAPAVLLGTPEESRAQLLEGYDYADCDDFSRWLRARVDDDRAARQLALTAALRAATQRGDLVDAQAHADALLALDRESEDAYRALMEVAFLRGDFAAAVRVWDECRDMLRQFYGVTPSAATQALGAKVLAASPAAPRPVAPAPPAPGMQGNLGLFAPTLYGRATEVAALLSALHGHRLVTLIGIGGIGKTSIALAAGHAERERTAGGVWFVDMAPVTEPANLPGAVAHVLGMSLPANSVDELVLALRFGPPMLLVLDNAEHLWEAVAALATALVARTLHLRLLVTSRRALRIAQEQRLQLSGLSSPANPDLSDPQQNGALALFEARASALRPSFRLTPDNAAAIADICRRLDGVPLAIELAAARVPVLGVEELQARLHRSLRVLGATATVGAPRQRTLRATFDWTHSLLSPEERALLRRLAVFVGGFTLDLAEQTCSADAGAPGHGPSGAAADAWSVVDDLSALIDNSLVVASDAEPPRYRLLEVTRAYALEKLVEAGELERVSALHAHAIGRLFASAEADLNEKVHGASTRDRFLRRLAPELDNLRAALAWSRGPARDHLLSIALAGTSTEAMRLLGLSTEALRTMLDLRDLVDDTVPADLAELFWTGLCALGTHGRLSRVENLEVIDKAERLYRRIGSARRIHVGLYRKGFALVHLGDVDDAQQALNDMDSLEAPGWPARAVALRLNLQGANHAARCNFDESIAVYRRAAALLASEPDERDVVLNVLSNLCMALVDAQRHEEALAVANDVLAGDPSPVVRILTQRAAVVASIFLGRLDEATALARRAMTGWRSDDLLGHMLSAFAWLAFLQGRTADAIRLDGAARAKVSRMGLSNAPVFDLAREHLERAIADQAVPAADVSRWQKEGERLEPEALVSMCVGA